MANVMITIRVMPSDSNVDIEKLVDQIKEKTGAEKIEKEPIAFGLVALKVTTLLEDKEGEVEKLENTLKSIEGIGEIETINISRTYI